jgi:hypothetical protein
MDLSIRILDVIGLFQHVMELFTPKAIEFDNKDAISAKINELFEGPFLSKKIIIHRPLNSLFRDDDFEFVLEFTIADAILQSNKQPKNVSYTMGELRNEEMKRFEFIELTIKKSS